MGSFAYSLGQGGDGDGSEGSIEALAVIQGSAVFVAGS